MTAHQYKIQQKIMTLSNAAIMDDSGSPIGFSIDHVNFTHWEFSHERGWTADAWLAESVIQASNLHEAYRTFAKKLSVIIPRASLITQGYISFQNEAFLIHRLGSDVAFFRYSNDINAVGLMFMEEERKALEILLNEMAIPDAFYYYWNDAVNTTGYPSKLLLMFSAIESLVKKGGKKDWVLIEAILGKELTVDLFGTKENPSAGLRHRLVHGEYFDGRDQGKNYLELVHNKIIAYFNEYIFHSKLLHENVTHPQRHFFGNKEGSKSFIRSSSGTFSLKEVLADFETHGFRTPQNYSHHFDEALNDGY